MIAIEHSRPKVAKSNARCVLLPGEKSRFTAGPRKPPQSREVSSATAKHEGAEAAATNQMDAEEADDTNDSSGKREATFAGATATGQRQKIVLLDGYTAQDNPGRGNCLFCVVSQALAAEGKQRTHAHLRATCVTHMRKHANSYRSFWDGKVPDGTDTKLQGTFEDYLLRISKKGAWVGYAELHALATTMDRPILVVRPSAARAYDFHHFNPDGKGKQLNLWFQGSHYQYLKGVKGCYQQRAHGSCYYGPHGWVQRL